MNIIRRFCVSTAASNTSTFQAVEKRIHSRYDRFLELTGKKVGLQVQQDTHESVIAIYFLDILGRRGFRRETDKVRRTDKLRLGDLLPEPPAEYTKASINRYVTSVSELDFRRYPSLMPHISRIYNEVTNSPDLKRLSFKRIIRFFAKTYRTLECFEVRDKMIKMGYQPDTEVMNLLLETTLQKHHPNRIANVLENLQIMDKYHLLPNATTFHILFRGLRDLDLKRAIYRKMETLKIDMRPVQDEFFEYLSLDNRDLSEIRTAMQEHGVRTTSVAMTTKAVKELLARGEANEAWRLTLDTAQANDKSSPSFRVVRNLLWHFILTGEIYFAIALTNFLKSKFPDYEDLDNWKLLVQGMVYVNQSEHWDLLAKKLYQLNYRAAKHSERSIYFDAEEIAKINAASANPRFDIREPFTNNIQQLVMDEIFRRLIWQDHPEFDLEKNSPNFKEAARLLIQ
ncbi:hypothetical protein KL929_001340 [Ogataea haglerorum]|uniref:ATPase expression protein 2, mitochondrial n=1 Tax=Ogataea haglerorum TaxID=1937702 RepID=A0ABQ7RK49_9ASCO|nr:uncharacterized protein KL911_001768 [Ogataea haglerorum]KAG7698165.1 hypothetical protein KL915_001882 [Ogataea haglerorum]KAG7708386.1 hypothetical protein KL914_002112 [Ogataea haglerorum]KAG7744424.1 hypothetical protein KL932_000940 [Ogataea haglerorum]KAG7755711.1 hypothetical protein KL911_001768 [Ogataea haglerorum]KAG7767288.1 hypothetical protein KL946_001387 [Ogataea haglerorum]